MSSIPDSLPATVAQAAVAGKRPRRNPYLFFLLRRIGQALIVIFVVTVVVFALLQMLPGGPARGVLGVQATAEQIAQFNHEQGYDRPTGSSTSCSSVAFSPVTSGSPTCSTCR